MTEMASTLVILALVVFLAGAATGIFAVLTVSIRRGQRTKFLSNAPGRSPGSIARKALVGIRDDSDSEEDQ